MLLVVVALLLAAVTGGTAWQAIATRREIAATAAPGTFVDVGGHRLHIWCTGAGAPAVILDSGLGGSSVDWGFVQPAIASFTRVCSYDRAGMGYSDAGPSPRTARRIANELAALLDGAGIRGPVILAGASLGGINVRVFATEYATRAAGLVLVDASHEDQPVERPSIAPYVPLLSTIGAFRLLGVSFGQPVDALAPDVQPFARATRFRASGYRAAVAELNALPAGNTEVRAARRTLDIPLVVVSAGRGADEAWRAFQRDQISVSSRGCQMIAQRSGHTIPLRQPEIVVAAVRATIAAAGRTHGTPCDPDIANVTAEALR